MTTKPKLIDEGESYDAADHGPVVVDPEDAARLEQEALDRLAAAGWPTDG